jgi:hypothetical protein
LFIVKGFQRRRLSRERRAMSDNVLSWTGMEIEDIKDPADKDTGLEGKLFCNWLRAGRRFDEVFKKTKSE